jgi:hypothetical protein
VVIILMMVAVLVMVMMMMMMNGGGSSVLDNRYLGNNISTIQGACDRLDEVGFGLFPTCRLLRFAANQNLDTPSFFGPPPLTMALFIVASVRPHTHYSSTM